MKAKVLIVTREGKRKYVDVPLELLATEGEAVLRMLETQGLEISSQPRVRELVLEYLRQSTAWFSSVSIQKPPTRSKLREDVTPNGRDNFPN
jgi:hypothetical protein